MQIDPASVHRVEEALAPLRADRGAAAIFCDLDGTLAPIVGRPGDAAVPPRARAALRSVAGSYAITAIVTGRPAAVARGIVDLGELTYVGNHGYELLGPGEEEVRLAPELRSVAEEAAAFVADLEGAVLEAADVRVENKGPIVALHWRGASAEAEAEAVAESFAAEALERGLDVHRGRKVLELRPRVRLDKGTAVEALLAGSPARTALYAGDDRTDLDAFAALERMRRAGELDDVVRVGVRSAEGPAEIAAAADLVVDGPDSLPELLELLAG